MTVPHSPAALAEAAEAAYAAYCDAMRGLDHNYGRLPEWRLLPPSGRAALVAAVEAAEEVLHGR